MQTKSGDGGGEDESTADGEWRRRLIMNFSTSAGTTSLTSKSHDSTSLEVASFHEGSRKEDAAGPST